MNYFRTDLACELRDTEGGRSGIRHTEEGTRGRFRVGLTEILSREASEATGKPEGRYVTVELGPVGELDDGEAAEAAELLAQKLGELCDGLLGKRRGKETRVLAVGLGNAEMTADAIGPMTVSRVTVTNHLSELEPKLFESIGCCRVCAVAPGVLGETGIESARLVRGAVDSAKPDLVIAVDALAAGSVDRLAATVQMSDTGICPGSGIGNRRNEISRATLGVPVISVGIPTVVDSSTLVYCALHRAGMPEPQGELADLLEKGRGFFVCPKDSDVINRRAAAILANAIDLTFGINRAHCEYN